MDRNSTTEGLIIQIIRDNPAVIHPRIPMYVYGGIIILVLPKAQKRQRNSATDLAKYRNIMIIKKG
jgi:hypothetical protein